MSWGVKLTGRSSLPKVGAGIGKPTWAQIGQAAVRFIVRETQSGKDQDGRTFKPYSELYRELRAKGGYSRTPDLTVTGQMLGAVDVVQTTTNSVTIGVHESQRASGSALLTAAGPPSAGNPFARFAGKAASVRAKVQGTNRDRPWFGFGGPRSKRRSRIIQEAFDLYREALKRLGG